MTPKKILKKSGKALEKYRLNTAKDISPLTSGHLNTVWIDKHRQIKFKTTNKNMNTQAVIVGAGLAGLSIAYKLSKSGMRCIVLDDGYIGSGESSRTTAHITYALDFRYHELASIHGEDTTRLVAQSHAKAIDEIESIISHENIRCDFKRIDGYLFLHPGDKKETLEKEMDILNKFAFDDISIVKDLPLKTIKGPALHFPRQARFNPMLYMKGLCDAIIRYGGQIYTQTRASGFHKDHIVTAEGFKIYAKHIIIATNSPENDRYKMHTKQAPYRTYVVAGLVNKNSVPDVLFWDTGREAGGLANPYHYIRLQEFDKKNDLLIIGNDDHKTGHEDPQQAFNNLISWSMRHFPMIKEIRYVWSGQVIEPGDGIAFIGRNPGDKNVYIVTGHSGNGMTYSAIAGIVIHDILFKKDNPWIGIYEPSRKKFKAIRYIASENIDVIKKYTARLMPTEKIENIMSRIPRGEAAIVRSAGEHLAIYRDEDGEIHSFSAICPHLKCIVGWNNAEKTFDCPCHGSRFTNKGILINGPAGIDLEKRDMSAITNTTKDQKRKRS